MGIRKESQKNKEMVTKFDVNKFLRENNTTSSCGNSRWWTKVVVKEQRLWKSSKSFKGDTQQRQGEHEHQFQTWELTRSTLKMEKNP